MARVKINTPDHFIFETSCTVRVSDLNYGNHLGNDKLLAMAHQARVEFFEAIGASEKDFFGTGVIMADSAIIYQSEGFLNNQIDVKIAVSELSKVSFDLVYQFFNATTKKDLALIKTGMVCFNYETKKVENVPSIFEEKL